MESSDDSFVWSDASNDHTNESKMTMEEQTGNHEDESESGYTYKKKIQMTLFNKQHKNNDLDNSSVKKSKKRKHIDLDSPLKEEVKIKDIKNEPESDLDIKKKKRKISVYDDTLHDEDFLNLKVKEEQSAVELPSSRSLKAKKKKKHRSEAHENNDSLNNGESDSVIISNSQYEISSIVNISEISHSEDVSFIDKELEDTENDRTRKKKSKKKKHKYLTDETTVDDKFSAEEARTEDRVPNIHTADRSIIEKCETVEENNDNGMEHNEFMNNDNLDQKMDSENDENNVNSSVQLKINNREKKRKSSNLENGINNDNSILSMGPIKKLSPRMTKLSERIRFEEDDSLLSNNLNSNNVDNIEHSAQFRNYIKVNPHLKPITPSAQTDCIISPDDEIWVLKCPQEIDVLSLKDSSLVLDSKCKLKVDTQTYVGSIENNSNGVALLTLDESKPVIKNIPINGIVHLHKRIPKPHFQEDNTIINKQNNFISLPETKIRHPLFGANYKKAIKVPKHIAQRLNSLNTVSNSDNDDKKKKKKKKHKKEYNISDNELETKPKPEIAEVHHKKRKRKHSQDNETPPKLAKYLKHDPDSAEAWESEKGIEQQLFSF